MSYTIQLIVSANVTYERRNFAFDINNRQEKKIGFVSEKYSSIISVTNVGWEFFALH
jgi:hypothetical protein